jgi:ribonuclease D
LEIFKWRENTAKRENIPPNEIFQEKNLKKISSVVNKRKIKEFLWLIKEEIYREKFMEKFL